MPDQIFPASYGTGVAVCNHEKIVGHRGNGVVVVVSDDDAVVLAAFTNQCLNFIDVHRVNLREWLVEDIERRIAQQHQVQLGQAGFAAREFIDGRIVMAGKPWHPIDKGPVIHAVQFKRPVQLHPFRNQASLRQILDMSANGLTVYWLFVDAYHHVLYPEAAHQGAEHTGLAGTVAAQEARDLSGFGGDIPAAQHRLLTETDHHTIYYELVFIHR